MTTTPKETYRIEIIHAKAENWYNVGETYEVTKDRSGGFWRLDDHKCIYVSDTKIIQKEEQMTTTERNEKTLYICADSEGNTGSISNTLEEALDNYVNEFETPQDFKDYRFYKLTPVDVELKEV